MATINDTDIVYENTTSSTSTSSDDPSFPPIQPEQQTTSLPPPDMNQNPQNTPFSQPPPQQQPIYYHPYETPVVNPNQPEQQQAPQPMYVPPTAEFIQQNQYVQPQYPYNQQMPQAIPTAYPPQMYPQQMYEMQPNMQYPNQPMNQNAQYKQTKPKTKSKSSSSSSSSKEENDFNDTTDWWAIMCFAGGFCTWFCFAFAFIYGRRSKSCAVKILGWCGLALFIFYFCVVGFSTLVTLFGYGENTNNE